jgi:hypothetical protein
VFHLIPTPGAATPQVFSGATYTTTIPTALNDNSLSALLLADNVAVTGTLTATTSPPGTLFGVLFSLFPFLLMIPGRAWPAPTSPDSLREHVVRPVPQVWTGALPVAQGRPSRRSSSSCSVTRPPAA